VPLLKRGYEVHATYGRRPLETAEVVWHQCDLLDARAVGALVNRMRPSHLLHFAWNVEHGKYWTSPLNLEWLAASLQLIRVFQESGGERFVGAGTCAEYEWGTPRCVERETPLRPATLYGVSKNALREVAESFAQTKNFGFAWGRIFLTFGPHEDGARLVPSVARSLLKGEIAECSPGSHQRDFLYVEDVAEAFVALTDSEVQGSFNIGSGEPVRVKDVAGALASLAGRGDLLRLGALPERAGDPSILVADVGRLRKELGWKPRFSLRQALEDTVSWWRTEVSEARHASRV
jgi:nucleoside-diphosphate-sugar epimerase